MQKIIKLNQEEYVNLFSFMNRATMTGNETKAFVLLMQKVENAETIEEEIKKDTNKK